jgi:hypothetical protein
MLVVAKLNLPSMASGYLLQSLSMQSVLVVFLKEFGLFC